MWERVPGVGFSLHVGREQKSLESPDLPGQPATPEAAEEHPSYGLLPEDVRIGWSLVSE